MIRTLQKLPPFNSHVVGQNAAPHCRIPGKGSDFFFSFESATASCVSSGDLVATFSDVCGSRLVSAGTPRFVLDPTIVTPALSLSSAQFEFRMLNAKSREERINLELGLCELLLGSTVLSRD